MTYPGHWERRVRVTRLKSVIGLQERKSCFKFWFSSTKLPGSPRLLALRWSSSSLTNFFTRKMTVDQATLFPFRTS